jgi:hypothetical protein
MLAEFGIETEAEGLADERTNAWPEIEVPGVRALRSAPPRAPAELTEAIVSLTGHGGAESSAPPSAAMK